MYETTVFAIHGMCLDTGHSNDILWYPSNHTKTRRHGQRKGVIMTPFCA